MIELLNYLIPLSLAAVFLVLILGLWNMMKGGSASRSQNLMRWRVVLQFIAIIVLVGVLWFSRR